MAISTEDWLSSKIELLIGANASKIMEPWEIINIQGDAPYAVKTLVGWVINGPLRGCGTNAYNDCYSATVNRISEKLLISQYNQDFSERASEEKRELSFENKRFLKIANESVSLINGHYNLNLPFSRDDM